MSKKIAVVGAGPGGLAAAMLLASKGFQVDVYEKNEVVGGRNAAIEMDGFRFDMGPTFLSMIHIVDELFEATGRNMHDYMDLIELPEMYQLTFDGKRTLDMTRDREKMKERIEATYPGNSEGYDQFLYESGKKLAALTPILQSRMDKLIHYMRPSVVKALPELEIGKTLYDVLSRYFNHEELKLAFTFQSKYLGMSPWECPGAFSILSYMEHAYGIYHPIGGVNQLSASMAKVVEEYGGKVHLGTGVKKFKLDGKKVTGLLLESGEEVEVDEIVVNGDFGHVMTNLVDEGVLKKYSRENLDKKKYSCSTFMLYLGLDKVYDLPHHNIIFAKDYKTNVEEITHTKKLSADPSIYVQNASVTDPTLAPEGQSALYILAPVPNNDSKIGWQEEQQAFRDLVIRTIEEKSEFKDLSKHIVSEKVLTPVHWEEDISVFKGATFNLGHQLSQMMVFRPHNKFEELDGVWLVGGGTHPGSGLPTILESARIVTNGILAEEGKERIPVGLLPAWEGTA